MTNSAFYLPRICTLLLISFFKKPEYSSEGWISTGYLGIINTFASCSINSVIQLFYHLPNFKQVEPSSLVVTSISDVSCVDGFRITSNGTYN